MKDGAHVMPSKPFKTSLSHCKLKVLSSWGIFIATYFAFELSRPVEGCNESMVDATYVLQKDPLPTRFRINQVSFIISPTFAIFKVNNLKNNCGEYPNASATKFNRENRSDEQLLHECYKVLKSTGTGLKGEKYG